MGHRTGSGGQQTVEGHEGECGDQAGWHRECGQRHEQQRLADVEGGQQPIGAVVIQAGDEQRCDQREQAAVHQERGGHRSRVAGGREDEDSKGDLAGPVAELIGRVGGEQVSEGAQAQAQSGHDARGGDRRASQESAGRQPRRPPR